VRRFATEYDSFENFVSDWQLYGVMYILVVEGVGGGARLAVQRNAKNVSHFSIYCYPWGQIGLLRV
jgi:hypothetical protein